MTINKKRMGTRFEYRVQSYLEKLGWFVIRSSGSHTSVDIVAFKVSQKPLLVQCKTTQKPTLSISEKLELAKYKINFKAKVLVISRNKISSKLIFYVLLKNSLVEIEEPKWIRI